MCICACAHTHAHTSHKHSSTFSFIMSLLFFNNFLNLAHSEFALPNRQHHEIFKPEYLCLPAMIMLPWGPTQLSGRAQFPQKNGRKAHPSGRKLWRRRERKRKQSGPHTERVMVYLPDINNICLANKNQQSLSQSAGGPSRRGGWSSRGREKHTLAVQEGTGCRDRVTFQGSWACPDTQLLHHT